MPAAHNGAAPDGALGAPAMQRFANRTAIVTGCGKGLGRAITVALVEQGCFVVGITRSPEDFDSLKKQLGEEKLRCVQGDLATAPGAGRKVALRAGGSGHGSRGG